MKAEIKQMKVELESYGHWKITVVADNPALLLNDSDGYWMDHSPEDEPEVVTFKHTTTNSRAVDGHDGGKAALFEECATANGWHIDNFDLTNL